MRKVIMVVTMLIATTLEVGAKVPLVKQTKDGYIVTMLTFYMGDPSTVGYVNGIYNVHDYNANGYPFWNPGGAYDNYSLTKVVFDKSFADARPDTIQAWFSGLKGLKEIEGLEYLNTSETEYMGYLFRNCCSLDSIDVSRFETGKVKDMIRMFQNCTSLKKLDLSHFDVSNVIGMESMFMGDSSLVDLNLKGWQTKRLQDNRYSREQAMAYMFEGCSKLKNVDLSGFYTTNVWSFKEMFYGCSCLETVDMSTFAHPILDRWHNGWSFDGTFRGCSSLKSVRFGNDSIKVSNVRNMFYGCEKLQKVDVSKFNTSNCSNRGGMFYNCKSLEDLDISNFTYGGNDSLIYLSDKQWNNDWTKQINIGMLGNCLRLTKLNIGDNDYNGVKDENSEDAFLGVGTVSIPCKLIIGKNFDTSVLGQIITGTGGSPNYFNWRGGIFTVEGLTDAIKDVRTSVSGSLSPAYSISGQRVNRANYHGIYILNGRKVLNK